ncbi:MAG TPA: bifunctional YncE family protein/alkaline phosphatase family protein [Candidatus Acidoferrales bacterium]|nr:bifunctional YncE family protein/alkaline phosphatase family protein [Candidatus Acidoferrales bacterium]
MKKVRTGCGFCFLLVICQGFLLRAQSFSSPAGIRPAHRHENASVLPGGRVIQPLGETFVTGAGPFGLAINPSGKTLVTADGGPGQNSLTILERERSGEWVPRTLAARDRDDDRGGPDLDDGGTAGWRGVFMGIAFASEHSAYVSEGNSGRISWFDFNSDRRRPVDLNQNGYRDSYAGDLAFDAERNLLYAVDQANFRVAVIDTRTRAVLASVKTGRLPFALALSPNRRRLYVTNLGMFEYQAIPGADPKNPLETGLPFPAFGFPSPESITGAERTTARGPVRVPGLGEPNVREANSVCVIDVSKPNAPSVVAFVATGAPFSAASLAGASPSGIAAAGDRVFVSNANLDTVTAIDASSLRIVSEISIRIPGLEQFRGVLPIGLAYHAPTGWLFAAEAGINAVAVIDPRQGRVLGHLPAGWFPTRVAVDRDQVFVAAGRGFGQGPNAVMGDSSYRALRGRHGSVSLFRIPEAGALAGYTRFVLESCGFIPRPVPDAAIPSAIRHVVLIVKENRTYDEVFGDVPGSMGAPELARFGLRGFADGRRQRLSIKDISVTPNHHALARQFAISDNFYTDSDVSVDGHHWLVGSPPNAWTESSLMAAYSEQKKDFRLGPAPGRLLFAGSDSSVHPEEQLEGGTLWHHLERHGIPFRNYGEGFELAGVDEGKDLAPTGARFLTNVPMPDPLYRNTSRTYPGFNMNITDQFRATQFINEVRERGLERFTFIHLPNDHTTSARPADGYPYGESFVADNDYALGRIIEFLSTLPSWKDTAVFITEDDAQSGIDHIDAHRTVLIAAGPWIRHGYISHRNSSFPGLLKTIFRLLGIPPLNLYDAAATDLSDLFAEQPDPAPYKLLPVDARIFDPATARNSTSGKPSIRMDR